MGSSYFVNFEQSISIGKETEIMKLLISHSIKNDSGRYFRVAKYQFKINNKTQNKKVKELYNNKTNNTK